MTDGPDTSAPLGMEYEPERVRSLATRVLSVIAARSAATRVIPEARVLEFVLAHARGEIDSDELLAAMRRYGISNEAVADVYIPAAARDLGEAWCNDAVSFADVTIGGARLQRLLRELGPEWRSDRGQLPDAPMVLVVVMQEADHTLGAVLLAGQLRRLGFSVKLSLAQSLQELSMTLACSNFDMIMLSSAGCEKLAKLKKLLKVVGEAKWRHGPVVLGGVILDSDRDLDALDHVDHFTSDIFEALDLCGLTIPHSAAGSSATRI